MADNTVKCFHFAVGAFFFVVKPSLFLVVKGELFVTTFVNLVPWNFNKL